MALQFLPRTLALPELGLVMDPSEPAEFAFVSHGHADHFAPHQKILCSEGTGAILVKRYGVDPGTLETHPFEEPWGWKGHLLCLYPAGHIAGSAMLRIEKDDHSLLYTGDFKIRDSLTVERPVFPKADELVMETTFGLPRFVFPPTEDVAAEIVSFAKETLADGEVPVIFGYSLGKAQEALAILQRAGVPAVQTKPVFEMTQVVRSLGLGDLDEPVLWEKGTPEGAVLIAPPNAVRSQVVRRIKNKRLAMLSGWALTPGSQFRYQTDVVFPLSDHADFPGLLEAVEVVGAKKVHTLHGSTREFARTLRDRGVEAWSIYGDDQLELLGGFDDLASGGKKRELKRPKGELARFTDVLNELMSYGSRLKKVELLADFLRSLEGCWLETVLGWLVYDPVKGLGSALIKQALLDVAAMPPAAYKRISSQQNDVARTGRLVLEEAELSPKLQSFAAVRAFFKKLREADAGLIRTQLLTEKFRQCHPMEGETLIRLLGGGLRVGVKEGLLEEAVAAAFEVEPSAVRQAVMLSGSLPRTAVAAREGTLGDVTMIPGSPVKPMLASPTQTSEDLLTWAGGAEAEIWVEEKYDGIRAQLHLFNGQAALFSRDLKELKEFPELVEAAVASGLPDCILDGEVIAFAEGKKLTFFDLQKRLGRKQAQGDLFLGASVPVKYVAFDCLAGLDAKDLVHAPLRQRREVLEQLNLQAPFEAIAVKSVTGLEELEEAFKSSVADGQEGLIAKEPGSGYTPGRRGQAWRKLKGVMPTLDCVVVRAQQGHGKRSGVLSDYSFAVRDERDGQLKILGKAYSGLTDVEIEELTEHFKRTAVKRINSRVLEVEPTVVLEIAFDTIRRSKRHDSGLALRFPRIKQIRKDKSVDEIDTLQAATGLL